MDYINEFLSEQYTFSSSITDRVSFIEIYTEFRMWAISKYGPSILSGTGKNMIYDLIRKNAYYPNSKRRDGYFLDNIIRKPEPSPITPPAAPQRLTLVVVPKPTQPISDVSSTHVSSINAPAASTPAHKIITPPTAKPSALELLSGNHGKMPKVEVFTRPLAQYPVLPPRPGH
jgi:hypothetical protein